jgi:hypothetical protein
MGKVEKFKFKIIFKIHIQNPFRNNKKFTRIGVKQTILIILIVYCMWDYKCVH